MYIQEYKRSIFTYFTSFLLEYSGIQIANAKRDFSLNTWPLMGRKVRAHVL
jgi:hypothetical protein